MSPHEHGIFQISLTSQQLHQSFLNSFKAQLVSKKLNYHHRFNATDIWRNVAKRVLRKVFAQETPGKGGGGMLPIWAI